MVGEPRYRVRERDFSRNGPISPEFLTVLLLFMISDASRRGYGHMLQAFWDEAAAHELPLPLEEPVSAASFCEARQKLSSDLLRDILHELTWSTIDGHDLGSRRWKGRRVFAVDGTKIATQRSPELQRVFGGPSVSHCPQVMLSVLVDVCARIPMDLEVSPYASSEREQLDKMLASLEAGDVLVLDRGYPSHDLIQKLSRQGTDFLMRVPATNTFPVIDEFRSAGSCDRVMTIQPPSSKQHRWPPIQVRVVRITNDAGAESFYITSLRRPEVTRADIAHLYHMRWEAEEFFKLLKSDYIGQRQYRSRSAQGVVQEIHAAVLFLAVARLCMCVASETSSLGCDEQLSQKGAVLALDTFLPWIMLLAARQDRLFALKQAIERMSRKRVRARPARTFPRRSFKPQARWGPKGHRGGA